MAPRLGMSLSPRCDGSMEPGKLKLQTPIWGNSRSGMCPSTRYQHTVIPRLGSASQPQYLNSNQWGHGSLAFPHSSPKPGVFLSSRQPKHGVVCRAGTVILELGCVCSDSGRQAVPSGCRMPLAGSPWAPPCVPCPFCLCMLSQLAHAPRCIFGGNQLSTNKKTSMSSFLP